MNINLLWQESSCNKYTYPAYVYESEGNILGDGFLFRFALAAFRHNGIVETVSEAFWKLVKLIIAVNFDGFLGGVHHDVAFVAPMEMFVELEFQVLGDLAVKIIGQLF